ncbi:MAG TPA: tetratricopeptide repeat protein [Verrucomicrobiae bacterium]|nr:tetratricopeptide repeat protein [Verrucomicrobiae bacterium]
MSPPRAAAFARRPAAQAHPSATVEGSVRNSSGAPVAGANVVIERSGETRPLETKTNPDGTFTCSLPSAGTYTVRAEKAGVGRGVSAPLAVALGEKKRVVLILSGLGAEGAAPSNAKAGVNSAAATPEFEDTPDFTVAGVSGWSNLGLHGSQANARTSETLANETLALKSSGPDGTTPGSGNEAKGPAGRRESENELRTAVAQTPESFEANHRLGAYYLESRNYSEAIPLLETANRIDPGNSVNADDLVTAYINSGELAKAKDKIEKMLAETNTADLHRRLGDAEEQSGDSLGAVHEYETAVRLDPSEENYFAWGTELLLHRADQPAVEVFTKGSKAYPNSARMLAGLGAALYAGDAYEAGARRLCEASDLEPAESAPYIFLGEMEIAASAPLPCSEPRLERFVQKQPENALANYYYATALLKRVRGSENLANTKEAETLLKRAVTIDPKLGAAFLELGSLYAGRNEFSQAIGAYQKAVEASPDLADAYYQLGVTYRRTGEEAKSHREFQAYEQAEKKKAAADEQRRGELRQFLIVLQKPTTATDSR